MMKHTANGKLYDILTLAIIITGQAGKNNEKQTLSIL